MTRIFLLTFFFSLSTLAQDPKGTLTPIESECTHQIGLVEGTTWGKDSPSELEELLALCQNEPKRAMGKMNLILTKYRVSELPAIPTETKILRSKECLSVPRCDMTVKEPVKDVFCVEPSHGSAANPCAIPCKGAAKQKCDGRADRVVYFCNYWERKDSPFPDTISDHISCDTDTNSKTSTLQYPSTGK